MPVIKRARQLYYNPHHNKYLINPQAQADSQKILNMALITFKLIKYIFTFRSITDILLNMRSWKIKLLSTTDN
jgi:hypothetical protein